MYIVRLLLVLCLVNAAPVASDEFSVMCIKTYQAKDQLFKGVTSPLDEGSSWPDMDALCGAKYPGFELAAMSVHLAVDAQITCPNDVLVPVKPSTNRNTLGFPVVGDNLLQLKLRNEMREEEFENPTPLYDALDWSIGETISVGDATNFRCCLCQMVDRDNVLTQGVYPPNNNSIYAYDLELVSNDQIHDIGLVANGSDLTNKLLDDLAEAFEIPVKSLRWQGSKLNGDLKAVVHVYYDREDVNKDWFYYVHWADEYVSHKSVDDFQIAMIKLNTQCSLAKEALQNTKRRFPATGDVDVVLTEAMTLTTRECYWDDAPEVRAAVWSAGIEWWIVWGFCDMTPGFILRRLQMQGHRLDQELKTIDIESDLFMLFAADSDFALGVFSIKALVGISNMLLGFHEQDRTQAAANSLLGYSLPAKMAKLYLRMLPMEGDPVLFHGSQYANVVVAAVDPTNPVVGMAMRLSTDNGHIATEATLLNGANMSSSTNTSHIVVTVSNSITLSASSLHIAMYGAHLDKAGDPPLNAAENSWMSVVVVAFVRNATYDGKADKDFVDIAFKPAFRVPTQRGNCAEWNTTTSEWFTGLCRVLRSTRAEMAVCRCKFMALFDDSAASAGTEIPDKELVITGTYIIYAFDASLSTYLANNLILVIVIIIVGILSAAGLLCVVLTAVFFPEWRKDQGHKIFLHMIFALTANLVLGFVNSFISIDTKSVACIAIGVLRHYSFLAMFVWMMTLSGLQLRRLTTVAGSKATTHLILKVALIAWGVPLVPIAILLAWDTGFYKSEVTNRGYCYPEGVAFQVTVQSPAGVILVANLFVFVFILNHIYGWVKFNKDVVVRKHTAGNERAAQLRRLCTAMFIFFLFGFTWVFHFLSEEGIINNEFMFEFLFLITASFHLFMLALFIIVLDKKTRQLWQDAGFGC